MQSISYPSHHVFKKQINSMRIYFRLFPRLCLSLTYLSHLSKAIFHDILLISCYLWVCLSHISEKIHGYSAVSIFIESRTNFRKGDVFSCRKWDNDYIGHHWGRYCFYSSCLNNIHISVCYAVEFHFFEKTYAITFRSLSSLCIYSLKFKYSDF